MSPPGANLPTGGADGQGTSAGLPPTRSEYPAVKIMEYAAFVTAEMDDLSQLARAFRRTGNQEVAETLWDVAGRVTLLAQAMRDFASEASNDALAASQEATGSMLRALVAGVRLGGNDELADPLSTVFAGTAQIEAMKAALAKAEGRSNG